MTRDVEYFRVVKGDPTCLVPVEPDSMVDLAEGEYVVKPTDKQGCWMDAVSFVVLPPDRRLWENTEVLEAEHGSGRVR